MSYFCPAFISIKIYFSCLSLYWPQNFWLSRMPFPAWMSSLQLVSAAHVREISAGCAPSTVAPPSAPPSAESSPRRIHSQKPSIPATHTAKQPRYSYSCSYSHPAVPGNHGCKEITGWFISKRLAIFYFLQPLFNYCTVCLRNMWWLLLLYTFFSIL